MSQNEQIAKAMINIENLVNDLQALDETEIPFEALVALALTDTKKEDIEYAKFIDA